MPVLVTRADHGIGPDLVAGLSGDGADVRAYVAGSGDVASVQASGAFVAVGDLDDEGHLDAAMTDVHTVIVPTEAWLAEVDGLDAAAATIVAAAQSAAVRRIVLVSVVGADPRSGSVLRAAHGRAEAVLADASMQTLVVRIDGIVEHGMADIAAAVACDPLVAPVPAARLVDGLVTLDAARTGRDDGHAVFTALGPRRRLSTWRGAVGAERSTDASALVGRRWFAPARRGALDAALCSRGDPEVDGADLWSFVDSPATPGRDAR